MPVAIASLTASRTVDLMKLCRSSEEVAAAAGTKVAEELFVVVALAAFADAEGVSLGVDNGFPVTVANDADVS